MTQSSIPPFGPQYRSPKVVDFEELPASVETLKQSGKKVVHCHGTFDLVHPGHVIHLEEAREHGDALVVTITAEPFVNKGPGRPYFNDHLRTRSLAALASVDLVSVVPYAAAVEAIEAVKPDIYCKGKEYADPGVDPTGNIHDDLSTVERFGGKVCYIGSQVFSSTKLLNRFFEPQQPEVLQLCQQVAQNCSPEQFRDAIEDFSDLRVLVIGDTIFDRYSTLKVQGLTSKNRIISGRFVDEDTQAGGALAVFRHIKQFCPRTSLLSLVGTEPWVDPLLSNYISDDDDQIVRSEDFTTIIKQRFVEPLSEGKEMAKLFSVNYIDAVHPEDSVINLLLDKLSKQIKDYDMVVVADFGHGMMREPMRDFVQLESPFMALNCQTNSNNHGFNIINRRYRRADVFSLDEQELLLACGRKRIDFPTALADLKESFGSQYAWLTRGAVQTLCLHDGEVNTLCPPLATSVVDTIGAGDAFYSLAALASYKGLPASVTLLMGQLAGAQAVGIVGNAEPISKPRLIKGGMSLLNF